MHAMQDERGASLTPSPQSPSAPAPDSVQGRSRLFALLVVIGVLTLALDQGSKIWALTALTPGEPRDLLGPVLRLNLIRNAGAAFSLGDGATWLEVRPSTGRSHQIRVQLASRGLPILGDRKYGARRALQALDGLPRVALHARELRFKHPTLSEPVVVTAPTPEDWPGPPLRP